MIAKRKDTKNMERIADILGLFLISIIALVIIGVSGFLIYHRYEMVKNKQTNIPIIKTNIENEKILYDTIYYFGMGSRKVKIYENGEVYDDLEIEDPNHQINYQWVKTLSEEQLNMLKTKIQNAASENEIDALVIELVYGVKEFDDMGGYK